MDADVAQRFADFDARLDAFEERTRRFRDATADAVEAMEDKLAAIDRQNQQLAEMVQVLGSYVNVGIEGLQQHIREQHGGG